MFFINQREIPTLLSSSVLPGQPHILSFEPTTASVSDIITITGINFGTEKGNSQVYFTLASVSRAEAVEDSFIAASTVDFDYISWTNNEIKLRVPDGASSGRVWVNVNNMDSNSFYFERVDSVGTRTFGERRNYKVSYDVVLNVNEASGENSISFWVPMLSSSAEQRNIEYERNIPPNLDNFSNMMLYQFNNLRNRDTRIITITAWLERHEVRTRINRERAAWDYARDTPFYREYTGDLFNLKTNDPRLDSIFREVVRYRDPYTTAESIYNIILRNMSHTQNPSGSDVIDSYIRRSGDSYTYAMMFTLLARKAGIPARPVAGFFVFDNNRRVVKHYWSEFYIRRFGWVPVDLVLGSGITFANMRPVENPRTYYFGNLGSGHIAFSRGILSAPLLSPTGRAVFKDRMYSLQTSYEEVSGNIDSYRTWWNELKIPEWW